MNQLDIEASWVLKNLISENLIDETDTAVIFQSFNQLDNYLTHLKSCFP